MTDEDYCSCSNPKMCEVCNSGMCHNCGGVIKNFHILKKKTSKLYWEHSDELDIEFKPPKLSVN